MFAGKSDGGPPHCMSLIEDCAGLAGAEPQTWGTGLMNNIIFVGLDVHKETIAVAVAEGRRGGEVRELGNFLNRPDHIQQIGRAAGEGRSYACHSVTRPGRAAMAFIGSWSPLATNAWWWRRRSFR